MIAGDRLLADGDLADATLMRAHPRHVAVAPFIVNNRPETMDRSRQPFLAAAGWSFTRVPGAAQHEVMRCRPGTVPVCGGPGSALHRSTSLRAAPRPGHAIASDAFTVLFTMSNSPSRSRCAFLRPGFATLLRSPQSRVGGAPRDVRVLARHP